MAPRAVSTIGDKDLPLATSELDMTIQSCLDYVCSGKALEFSGVTTQIGRSVYNGLKAVSKDDLPEEGLTVEIVKQYLLDTVGYFCTTFGVEDCNNFEDNMVCYLLPVLVESDLLLKKPSESELRDLRHDKIAATKDLAFDPFSFFSPTFPQYFSQLHQPDPTVEAAVVAAPKPAVGDGLLFSASPVETGFPAVKSVSTSSKDPRHDVLGLLPKFELKDAVITSQERRQARKSVKDIELLKGGVFTGKGDSRSMRRVLTYVRDVAIEEAFTALEYRELLKRQISQTARAAVHPRRVTTQPALIQELRREVSSFLSLYGQGDSGKLDSWKSLLFLSQGKSEKVATFAQRFDDAYNDAVCLGNVIDDAQAALQFASALNEQWSISAATLIAAGVTSLADLTSRLVAEEKLFKHSVNVKVSVGNVDSTGGKTIFVSSTQRVGGQATKEDGVRSCFYCHQPGHLKADCPQLRAKRQNKPDPIGKDQTAKSVPKEGTDKVTSVASIGVVKSNDMESDIFSPSTRMVSVCGTGTAEHASPKIDHKALFDTGSVNNFISRNLVDLLQSSSIELEVNPLDGKTIKLADGSLRESMGVISLLIGVDGVSRSLSFYVLSSLCPDLIIGWDGMCTLGVIVKTQQNEIVCTGAVFGEKKEDSEEPQCLARMAKGSSPAILGTDDFHHDPFSELIISESYWYHLPSAPGYRIRVRRLREGEQKDTEKQVFVFELDLKGATKPTTTTPRTSNYSERLISRLSEEDRELFYAEVDGYLSRGWWQEEIPSPQGTDNSLPPITVFPVKAPGKALSSTPIRPCCDARAYNNLAEPAGYLGADISSLTSRLLGAYRKGDSLYMLDCIRAFYRLRTNWFLPLMVGRKRFWSNRVIFGISAGPSCLEFAMTFLLRYVAALDPSLSSVRFDVISGCCKVAGSWIYLDDVTLMGNGADGKLERFYKLFVETAEKFGLYFPPEKQNYLSPFKASGSVTHLGSLWSIVDDHLQCSCRRDIKGFQQLFSEPGKSKRDYFAIGGKLVDYPNDHARARLASDLLRSIIGGFQTPWDERVQLGEGEARQVDTLLNVLKEDFDTPCSHLSATGDVAILECDASAAGYGYIFSCGSYHASRAKAFRTNQLAWHVNRKEAWCIIQGLLSILPFLEEYCPSSTGVSCPLTLKVVGDSKSALAWACDNRSNVRSVERLAIRRMLNTLDDIRAMFDKMNIRLEFVRVPGSSNLGADELSRLLLKWKVCPCEGTKPDSTSDLSALCSLSLMVEGANEDEEILKNGGKEVCQSLMSLETSPPATVVQWLLSLQKCDPFINSVREFLVEGKKDAYLERLLRDHGRQYELNHCGLVVECRYTDNLEGRICILLPGDPDVLAKFARHYHENNSHCSVRYVTYLFSRDFYAPKFKQVVRSVIRACGPCAEKRVKLASSGGKNSYGQSTSDLSGVWSTVYADTADILVKDRFGYRYLLVIVDSLCGFCWLSPLKSLEAVELVRVVSGICNRIGWPRKFVSDGGRNFTSKLTKTMFCREGVLQDWVPRYAAFSRGRAERCIGSIKAKMQTLNRSQKREWSIHIPTINKSINLSPLSTGTTPFDIFFQRRYDSPHTVRALQGRLRLSTSWLCKKRCRWRLLASSQIRSVLRLVTWLDGLIRRLKMTQSMK